MPRDASHPSNTKVSTKTSYNQPEDRRHPRPASAQQVLGWRGVVAACGLLAILLPIIAFSLSSAFSSLMGNTLESALRRNAAATANSWAQYFARNFSGFDQVLSTGTLDTTQREFIEATQQIGQVYRFKLFDARGRLVVSSDNARESAAAAILNDHNLDAVRVIKTGQGIVRLVDAAGQPGEPAFTALAFVAVQSEAGEPLGVVAIHVDQTMARAAFQQSFNGLSFKLSGLAVVIFLVPALGFGWRSVQIKQAMRRLALLTETAEQEATSPASEYEPLNRQIAALKNQAWDNKPQPRHLKMLVQDRAAFDDLIAAAVETKAQDLPEWIGFECRLGLGDLAIALDHPQFRRMIDTLLGLAAADLVSSSGDIGGQGVSSASIAIATSRSVRGIEVSISGNCPGIPHENLTTLVEPMFNTRSLGMGLEIQAMQKSQHQHGGGLDVRFHSGQGAEFIAWWPHEFAKREAA